MSTVTTIPMRLVSNRTTDGITPARMQVVAELPIEGVDSCTGFSPTHKQTNKYSSSIANLY